MTMANRDRDEERRRPLSYEEGPIIFAHNLQDSGPCHGADGCSKVPGGRNLRGLRFNAGGELVFPFAVAARSGARKIHELLLKSKNFLSMRPGRMAQRRPRMPWQSPISGCRPVWRNTTGFSESLKYLRVIFDSGTVTAIGRLSFPQFDVRKAKTADV